MAYSEKVIDHYENPRNVGSFDKEDPSVGSGMVGAPACGPSITKNACVELTRSSPARAPKPILMRKWLTICRNATSIWLQKSHGIKHQKAPAVYRGFFTWACDMCSKVAQLNCQPILLPDRRQGFHHPDGRFRLVPVRKLRADGRRKWRICH